MEKIAVISVYYGVLPPNYELWLRSCEYNKTIDFLFITDIELESLPSNVKLIKLTFAQFRKLAEEKLGMSVRLDKPYKLCDFRPMYGQILEDYLIGYDYWAHCDMDLIFGDLRSFFDKYDISHYDRFLYLGHLSLYRNTPHCNQYYKLPGSKCGSWEEVVSTPQNHCFDECVGIYEIFRKNNLPIFEKRVFADIAIVYNRFRLALDDINYDKQVFYWENGHVYRSYWLDGKEFCDEFIYIHFKKRNFSKELFDAHSATAFFIGPNGFTKKKGKVSLTDVDRINPYPGIAYEKMELRRYQFNEMMTRCRQKLNRIISKM